MSNDPVFDAALAEVLRDEGGYVNDPVDPGGETKYGISKRAYPDLDIANLTQDQAAAIYRRDWWDRYSFGRLPAVLAIKVLDMAVNMGAHRAVTLLQRALGDCGHPIADDGALGPITIACANSLDPNTVLVALRVQAQRYYVDLVEADPDDMKFLHGWIKRAME